MTLQMTKTQGGKKYLGNYTSGKPVVLHIFSEARTRRKDLNSIGRGALCWVRNSYGKQN